MNGPVRGTAPGSLRRGPIIDSDWEVYVREDRESTESLTDDEAEFLRHVRFGELPPRVRPEERVELLETDVPQDVPEPAGDPDFWGFRMGTYGS